MAKRPCYDAAEWEQIKASDPDGWTEEWAAFMDRVIATFDSANQESHRQMQGRLNVAGAQGPDAVADAIVHEGQLVDRELEKLGAMLQKASTRSRQQHLASVIQISTARKNKDKKK